MRRILTLGLIASLVPTLNLVHGDQDAKAVTPFNGKNRIGWQVKSKKIKWVVGKAEMDPKDNARLKVIPGSGQLVNQPPSEDIFTEEKFGDGVFEVEFMIPKGSNSGIYLMGEYEVQILDSYGRDKVGPGDLGGLYNAAAPRVNASKKPGEWQTFIIDFRAPRFKDGKKTANARFEKVTLNGKVIHQNVEMKGPTPGGLTGKEAATGPLMFQGNHGPVVFRTIKFTRHATD
ncbi:MAG: DUF1080 domain-containing protein [Planctomycetes bacterium]|nr:DUF1080 domain-containing protein [Planctomycetota bacterium]